MIFFANTLAGSDPFLLTVAERKDQEVGNWNWIISADVTVKEIGVLNAEYLFTLGVSYNHCSSVVLVETNDGTAATLVLV